MRYARRHIDLGEHFRIQELVPQREYQDFGMNCVWMLDPVAVGVLKLMRRVYGPITVNDWLWGGDFEFSGYRPPDCGIGAHYSQHKFGRAFDVKSDNYSPDQIREGIINNQELWLNAGLTTIESGDIAETWVHFDTRPTNMDKIFIVKP